jgi:hypothetical protein
MKLSCRHSRRELTGFAATPTPAGRAWRRFAVRNFGFGGFSAFQRADSVRLMASPDNESRRDESRDNLDKRETAHAAVDRRNGDMIGASAPKAAKRHGQPGLLSRIGATSKTKPGKLFAKEKELLFAASKPAAGEGDRNFCTDTCF